MRRRAGRGDGRGMTTTRTTGDHHWSDILRFLAPGPIVLGMHSCVDPAVWHATWRAVGERRHAVQPQAFDEDVVRGTER